MEEIPASATVARKKRRCIFGTSANPPHLGHRDIVAYLASLAEFDEILVLPVYQHMYDTKRLNSTSTTSSNSSSFDDRLIMAQLAFSNISSNVIVSDLERQCYNHNEQRVGTADLFDFLKNTDSHADTVEYSLALGSDTFLDLMNLKWKRSNDVIRHVQGRLLVICRPTKQHPPEKEHQNYQLVMSKIQILNKEFRQNNIEPAAAKLIQIPELKCVSSTDARGTNKDAVLKQIIEPAVLNFIKSKQIYAFSIEAAEE